MITYRSTSEEIHRECIAINRILESKYPSAIKTFKNWLRYNRQDKQIVLSKQTYSIKNNKVYVWWIGERYAKTNDIAYAFLVEYPNRDGQLRYVFHTATTISDTIMGWRNNKTSEITFIYTAHFCQRMKQRLNRSFLDWFEEFQMKYKLVFKLCGVDEARRLTALMNNTYCFGIVSEDNSRVVYMTTVINRQQEFSNQLEEHRDNYRALIEFDKTREQYMIDNYGNVSTGDIIKASKRKRA